MVSAEVWLVAEVAVTVIDLVYFLTALPLLMMAFWLVRIRFAGCI